MRRKIENWFEAQGWTIFSHQRAAWDHFLAGREGLIHAPTGTGKTYAAIFGPLIAASDEEGLLVLWITPLRALSNDLAIAIRRPLDELNTGWTVEVRTGDTSWAKRKRQKERLPQVLITTPESLSLLLSDGEMLPKLDNLRAVIVDEWHELLGTKRGVLLELSLARLRSSSPAANFWGMSATIGNLKEAAEVLTFSRERGSDSILIDSKVSKPHSIETIVPQNVERFPRSGHMGLSLLKEVFEFVDSATTTLLFTNVRSQAEAWFSAVVAARPEFPVVLHHGSLDRKLREDAEARVKSGEAKLAIATSSLDLGVDFPPVDLVIQVGSPKGIARLLQRLGRSGHAPGNISRMVCVPTNSFELIEFSAARRAVLQKKIEKRIPLKLSLDVLVQHIITCGIAGFNADELFREVTKTHAFSTLSERQWQWALDFASSGGPSLRAYGQFQRLSESAGHYSISSPHLAKLHRMSIGTIVSDSMVSVRFLRGKTLGNVEESFIARIKPGESFFFAGKLLTLIQLRDMKAFVRKAGKGRANIPRWMGGRLPLSTHLADAVLQELSHEPDSPELRAASQIIQLQSQWSTVPKVDEVLIETLKLQRAYHIFVYPFAGFKVHEGLAALLGHRLTQKTSLTVTSIVNDYGIQLLLSKQLSLDEQGLRELFSQEKLVEDILGALNAAELAKRQFREIARIAGLVFQGYPGSPKTNKQIQISSSLLYDVFTKYDPENLLLEQAQREIFEEQIELSRLRACLRNIQSKTFRVVPISHLTPFSFPLWSSFTRSNFSSENWSDRIERMIADLEQEAVSEQPKRRNRR